MIYAAEQAADAGSVAGGQDGHAPALPGQTPGQILQEAAAPLLQSFNALAALRCLKMDRVIEEIAHALAQFFDDVPFVDAEAHLLQAGIRADLLVLEAGNDLCSL